MNKQTEAAKLALEALELGDDASLAERHEAITALREALSNEALDKMAENTRELGLDYTGNGTAGREADVKPTGFFFQMPAQTEAERLADALDADATNGDMGRKPDQKCHKRKAAAELRRLVSFNQQLMDEVARLQKREWVGLTDDDIDEGLLRSDYAMQTAHAWRAGVVFAMTKLKEKNT